MSALRDDFAALVAPGDRADLGRSALTIARIAYPALDVDRWLGELDALADAVRPGITPGMSPAAAVDALAARLFGDGGFRGNQEDYYDPRNSFLNDVLDRRTGIPITLSVVYSEVAQRLDLPVYGVSFPGHFLVKYVGEQEIIIDPFFGTVISTDECAQRLRGIYGDDARLDRGLLRPATAREILVRMLSNLKQVYVQQNDFVRALGCVDRILLLAPDTPRELRDRGILYQRLECFAAALQDFERYLRLAPDDDAAHLIRDLMPELHRQAAQLQ